MSGGEEQERICVDFDGVLHDYQGWKGAEKIDQPMVPGAAEFLNRVHEEGYEIAIFTTRFCDDIPERTRGLFRVRLCNWLIANGVKDEVVGALHFMAKPKATIYIDDRGFRFAGTFPTREEMQRRPWNRTT